MQSVLQKRVVGATAPARTSTNSKPILTVRPCKRAVRARRSQIQRSGAVKCKALFSLFAPKSAAPASIVDPRAKPLVEQLVSLTAGSDAGAKCSPEQKEEIAAVVTELSRYCIKNPVKSELLFGEWKVLFSSKPTAVGGPLRTAPGQVVFPAQNAKQIVEAPNKVTNLVEYKTLGFLPGFNRQFGELEPLSGDTFLLNISSGEIMPGVGGPIKKDFNIQRKIKILYLDEDVRVTLFLPSDEVRDNQAAQDGSREEDPVVHIFQRVKEQADTEDAEAPADDGAASSEDEEAPRPVFPFGAGRKLESAATVAERQVRQQLKEQRGGSVRVAPKALPAVSSASPAGGSARLALPAPRSASLRGRKQQQQQAEEEDPRERRRRQQEEERARKAAEAEARAAELKAAKERAEAERQAERERQTAIKELLAQLAAEIKERQAEAREAAKELKEVEKSAGAGLKEVADARSRVEAAEADVASVSAELEEAVAARRQAEAAAREARDAVVAAEKELRARIAWSAPVLPRK
ncbi:hypothetical protein Agub_g8896 [Astrephomene gubernaculifera]|uniref:Plastid lipid-associated protein/fibrillin conserved domain-containing protein n=1 Tax=Astrephomene gubernaculifera TaxID=47775 RepID=A0AAD3DSG6_9CHLO|nr:hypothetical protein Agub_g8896 [Astrephomene gubernaculifera]